MSRTREQWLSALTRKLRPAFRKAGAPLPDRVRVSCGWPSSKALTTPTSQNRTIGQCWPSTASADQTPEVFISPCLSDAAQVAATLAHELIHAALDCEHGHKAPFRKIALRIGLEGKMTSTHAGPELAAQLHNLCEDLGPYPHAVLDRSNQPKQGTRMIKLVCPECGYTVRTTRQWIEQGLPACPCDGQTELRERVSTVEKAGALEKPPPI